MWNCWMLKRPAFTPFIIRKGKKITVAVNKHQQLWFLHNHIPQQSPHLSSSAQHPSSWMFSWMRMWLGKIRKLSRTSAPVRGAVRGAEPPLHCNLPRTTPAPDPNLILTTNHFNLIMDLRGKPMKSAVVETTLHSWSLQKHSNVTERYTFNRDVFVKLVLLKNKNSSRKRWEFKIVCNYGTLRLIWL